MHWEPNQKLCGEKARKRKTENKIKRAVGKRRKIMGKVVRTAEKLGHCYLYFLKMLLKVRSSDNKILFTVL